MAVAPGRDFAVARKTAWLFDTGVGDATALMTRQHVFIFPHNALGGAGRTVSETTYTIGGRRPADAILELLANPATTPETLDQQMLQWSSQVVGPIVERMDDIKRVRVFTGFIRRSVVLSKKDKGYDLSPTSFRPKKDELPAFLELLKGRPGVEVK